MWKVKSGLIMFWDIVKSEHIRAKNILNIVTLNVIINTFFNRFVQFHVRVQCSACSRRFILVIILICFILVFSQVNNFGIIFWFLCFWLVRSDVFPFIRICCVVVFRIVCWFVLEFIRDVLNRPKLESTLDLMNNCRSLLQSLIWY